MKKLYLPVFISILLSGSLAFLGLPQSIPGEFMLEKAGGKTKEGLSLAQGIQHAMEARFNKLKDEYGNFYASYYYDAVKQANAFKQSGSRSGSLNLQWEELGPNDVGGRTRAILIDRRDPTNNTVYAGGVSGGMWKSTDGANTWTRLSNWNHWMAVSCIVQAPAPDNTIYIGTGEGLSQALSNGTSFNSGSIGNGIFKLDANDNATLITPDGFTPTNTLNPSDNWAAVNRIAINPNNPSQIIAATGRGLFKSDDAGGSWTFVTITGISSGQSAADVKWASDGTNIFAAVGGNNKIVRSPNSGATWYKLSGANSPGFPAATVGRIEIAIAPSDPNYVYLSIAANIPYGSTYGVYRTTNANSDSIRWVSIGNKGPLFDPCSENNQCWYDNTIAVSPSDPSKVYMGGVEFYTWSDQSGWKLDDAGLGGGNANPYYIHPDKHAIVIAANDPNLLYIGCDGGIYKSTNAVSTFPYPTFTVKNRGYNVTQNYSVGAAITGEVMGGTQDNGTNYINYLGNTTQSSDAALGGDGTYAEISHLDPRVMFGGIYFGKNLRSGNRGSSFDGFFDLKIDPKGFLQPSACNPGSDTKDIDAQFISPFWLAETKNATNGLNKIPFVANRSYAAGEVISLESKTAKYPFQYTLSAPLASGETVMVDDPVRSRFFMESYCGLWLTPDALDLGIIPRWYRMINGNFNPQSLASSSDGDVVYVGTNNGRVYRFGNFNARCDTTTYPTTANASFIYTSTSQYTLTVASSAGRSIEGISVDPNDNNHVVAVGSGFSTSGQPHVFETTDGGAHWNTLVTGLPNMPVYDVVVHDANTIIIGTELGVWSWDRTNATWTEENNGLQRVPVYRMIEKNLYNENCKVLYLGTHGRGMWRSTTLTGTSCKTEVTAVKEVKGTEFSGLNIFPNPVSTASKISINLDKSADVMFRIFDMTGKLYKEVTMRNTTAGENLFDLDIYGLSNGTYVLAATVANLRTQSRLFTVSR